MAVIAKSVPECDAALAGRYSSIRALTEQLAAPLGPEDQAIQSMADASPVKWHRAHTTWFFETLVLLPYASWYKPYDTRFHYLFNSYYEGLGPRHPRPQRGLITRPTCDEITAYRQNVDGAMLRLISGAQTSEMQWACELGMQHEQQPSRTRKQLPQLHLQPVPSHFRAIGRLGCLVVHRHMLALQKEASPEKPGQVLLDSGADRWCWHR